MIKNFLIELSLYNLVCIYVTKLIFKHYNFQLGVISIMRNRHNKTHNEHI